MYRKVFFLIYLVLSFSFSFGQSKLAKQWKFAAAKFPKDSALVYQEYNKEQSPIIVILKDDGTVGKMNGKTFKNTFSAKYEIKKKNKIKFTDVRGTKVGESCRLQFLDFVFLDQYKLTKEYLEFFSGDKKVIYRFVPYEN